MFVILAGCFFQPYPGLCIIHWNALATDIYNAKYILSVNISLISGFFIPI